MTYNGLNCVHQIHFFHRSLEHGLICFSRHNWKTCSCTWMGGSLIPCDYIVKHIETWGNIHRRTALKLEVKIKVNWKSRKTKVCQKTWEIKRTTWKRIFTRSISESMPDSVIFISGVCLQNCFNQPCSQPTVCTTLIGPPHKSDRIGFLLGVHLFLNILMTLLILSGNIALCVPKWIMSQDELCPKKNYVPLWITYPCSQGYPNEWVFPPNSVSRYAQCRQMNRWMSYGKKLDNTRCQNNIL